MIREWWTRQIDARRALSAALAAVSLILCILALAATPGFVTSGVDGPGGFAKYVVPLGGASGIALRAYLLHRNGGISTGLRSAVVEGGAMALLLLGMFGLAIVISPTISRIGALDGDAWLGILAAAVVVGSVSGVMWERDVRRRRTAVALLVAAGFFAGGILGLRFGGAASAIGGVALAIGIVALGRAMLQGFRDLDREIAESMS